MPMPCIRRRSGSSWIWTWRISPPNTATLDTPGTASSRGRSTQSTKVRCSIGVRDCDVIPTTSTVLDEEVSGVSTGGSTVAGSRHGDFAQPLRERLAGLVDVHPLRQHRGDDRKALDGLGSHGRDALHAVDRVLDRLGHLELDLLGREAGRFGLNGDLRRGELGKDVERGAGQRPRAERDERGGEAERDAAMPDRAADDRAQHRRTVRLTRPIPLPPSPGHGTPPTAAPGRR